MVREPIVREIVVDVVRIEEGHEHVDVEKRDLAHAFPSRKSLTCFIVGFGDPAGRRGSSGTPFRTLAARGASSALRASSETTFPSVEPFEAAISLAACRMSRSRSRVVRTHQASRITHR